MDPCRKGCLGHLLKLLVYQVCRLQSLGCKGGSVLQDFAEQVSGVGFLADQAEGP